MKLIIADNEAIERKALKLLLLKNFPQGSLEILEAKNGQEAVKLAASFIPDMIMMDIQMPVLDGLEASKQINTNNPDIEIVILTAFDYFDYAKEAIKLQVADYLLKPLSENKLMDMMTKVTKKIQNKQSHQQVNQFNKNRIEEIKPLINKTIIKELIQRTIEMNDFTQFLVINELEDLQYMCILLEKRRNAVKYDQFVTTLIHKLKYVFHKVYHEIWGDKLVLLVYFKAHEVANFDNVVMNIIREMDNNQLLSENEPSVFGLSKVYTNKEDIGSVYDEAYVALHNKKYMEIKIQGKDLGDYPILEERKIYDCLMDRDIDKAKESYGIILNYLRGVNDYLFAQMSMQQICFMIQRNMICQFKNHHFRDNMKTVLDGVGKCHDLDSLANYMEKYFVGIVEELIDAEDQSSDVVMVKAKLYIQEHYTSNFCSLVDVADALDISSYYLSRLFKDYFGMNFKDYVIELRMEKAKELLRDTKMTTKEISKLIGYEDPNYFSRAFKKYEGVPATVYARKYARKVR